MKYDVRWIQIYILVLVPLAVAGGKSWSDRYTQPDAAAAPSSSPVPPPVRVAPLPSKKTAPSESPAPVSVWVPPTSWLPDASRVYADVSTYVRQTDDLVHRSVWEMSDYPILKFAVIILLSSAILAVGRAWLRRCCTRAK